MGPRWLRSPSRSIVLREQAGPDGSRRGIRGSLAYATRLFDEGTAAAFTERLLRQRQASPHTVRGYRDSFRLLLDLEPDIEVVGEAGNGQEAVTQARALQPDVVLMDIRMPGTDGLEATRRISADDRLAGTKVLILSTFDLDEYVFEAIRSGANGFLVKDTEPAELLRAYDDKAGVTAEFNLNLLRRINRELGADFDTSKFSHYAQYRPAESQNKADQAGDGAHPHRAHAYQQQILLDDLPNSLCGI